MAILTFPILQDSRFGENMLTGQDNGAGRGSQGSQPHMKPFLSLDFFMKPLVELMTGCNCSMPVCRTDYYF